jgi:SAM-dependent methyltransferase
MREPGSTSTSCDTPADSACWVCGAGRLAIFRESTIDRELSPDDLRITDDRYGTTVRLFRCEHCGFIFADREQVRALVSLYQRLEDPDYEATADARRVQMQRILDATLRLKPQARTLLDIGAGIGLLVHEAAKRGLAAEGIEPSEWAVRVGRERFGATLHAGVFPHAATRGRPFDIIALVDVIEHVNDPVGLLTAIRDQLAPGGLSIIITPDIASLAARCFGPRWWHFRLAHVGYFNTTSLETAFDRAGLRTVRRRRAKWYFPIGYLSQRVGQYVPPYRLLHRALAATPVTRWCIPLNLFDSWCYWVTPRN